MSSFLIAEVFLGAMGLSIAAYCLYLERRMEYIGTAAWWEREGRRELARYDRQEAEKALVFMTIEAERRSKAASPDLR